MMRYGIGIVISGMLWGTQVLHTEAAVVINEVLADPPSGERGDANRDGTRDGSQDEFVEILNTGSESIDISGWKLSDRDSDHPFSFPENTSIAPGEYIVLFGGGGTPNECSMSPEFGKVCYDDGSIGGGLRNSDEAVFLITASNDTIASAVWDKEGNKDQSLVRYPEGTGR